MSTLTLEMLRAAWRSLGGKPIPSEIQVGSPRRFSEAMKERGGVLDRRGDRMNVSGVPVVFNAHLPEHLALVIENGEIATVVDLSKSPTEGKK